HLVLVGRSYATAGGSDLFTAGCAFGGQLNYAVIGEDDLRAVGYEELAIDTDAPVAQLLDFAQEGDRVEHHAVANHALAAGPQHAAGNQLQNKLLLAMNDRVPGVVPARVARHRAEPLAEHVYNFAFALIAPLGAQHYCRLRSHGY